jgi:hypothetical protein
MIVLALINPNTNHLKLRLKNLIDDQLTIVECFRYSEHAVTAAVVN